MWGEFAYRMLVPAGSDGSNVISLTIVLLLLLIASAKR